MAKIKYTKEELQRGFPRVEGYATYRRLRTRIKPSTAAQIGRSQYVERAIGKPPRKLRNESALYRQAHTMQFRYRDNEAARLRGLRSQGLRAVGGITASGATQRFFVPSKDAKGNPISRRASKIRLTRSLNAERRAAGVASITAGRSG